MASRVFQAVSTVGLIEGQGTDSGLTTGQPGAGAASYYDAATGRVVEGETGAQILQILDAEGAALTDKTALIGLIEKGQLKGTQSGRAMRPDAGAAEWDKPHFDLSGQPNPERAREIIIEQLRHPAMAWRKNQGGGRFQDIDFSGERTVLAWPLHTDQDEGPHFQAFIHTYAIKDGLVSPKASILDSAPRAALQAQINAALKAAGLNPIELSAPGASPLTTEAKQAGLTAENSAEFQEAAARGEVPELPEADDLPELDTSSKVDLIRSAQRAAEKEAAQLWAQANAAAQRAKVYAQAQDAIKRDTELLARLAEQEKRAEALTAEQERLKAELAAEAAKVEQFHTKVVDLDDRLTQAMEGLQEATANADAAIEERDEALSAARAAMVESESARAEAAATASALTEAQEAVENLAGQLKATRADLASITAERDTLAPALAEAQAQVAALASERDGLRDRLRDVQKSHDTVTAELDRMETRATRAEAKLKDVTEENAALRDDLDKAGQEAITERRARALAEAQASEAKATAEAQETRLAEQARQLAELRQRLAQVEAERDTAAAERDARPTPADLAKAKQERDNALATATAATAALEAAKRPAPRPPMPPAPMPPKKKR